MPEIKIKHIVSFSSEDKVHKAENLLKPEAYRKWKCATPGEKSATVVLQFEKAIQIHSIDIGNESSAFVEVLVGRSSDSVRDYQVLLVASSFMSPLESRNGTHTNRVRMFGPENLSQNSKEEKWDCVQVVCTQPFNKNITYGLSFIKFHSPPEKITEQSKAPDGGKSTTKLGAFKLKEDSDEDSLPSIGSWFGKKADVSTGSVSSSADNSGNVSFASAVLASNTSTSKPPIQNKRKNDDKSSESAAPPAKKTPSTLNKDHITYKDVLRDTTDNVRKPDAIAESKKNTSTPKPDVRKPDAIAESKKNTSTPKPDVRKPDAVAESKKNTSTPKPAESKKTPAKTSSEKASMSDKKAKLKPKPPFNKIMDKVVIVLSGFVNPLRSELREKALEMGAKYKADWDDACTHLICAFTNTPKYNQVKQRKGHIVTKEWILDCYRKKERLRWTDFALTNESSDEDSDYKAEDSSESSAEDVVEDSEEEYSDKKKKKTPQTKNQRDRNETANSPKKKSPPASASSNTDSRTVKDKKSDTNSKDQPNTTGMNKKSSESSLFSKITKPSPVKQENTSDTSQSPTLLSRQDDSETVDEDALQDYMADTDAEDDSGGDTEDEIRKVVSLLKEKDSSPKSPKMNGLKETKITEKPDVSDLPLPELPNLFKQKHFFLFGDFPASKLHDMQRYIIAYNGVIEDYMNDKVKYVITDKKWDSNFEDTLSENEDLIFVRPAWIYKCHDMKKLVPYQPHIVIPDS